MFYKGIFLHSDHYEGWWGASSIQVITAAQCHIACFSFLEHEFHEKQEYCALENVCANTFSLTESKVNDQE